MKNIKGNLVFYKNTKGYLHRVKGPAFISYQDNSLTIPRIKIWYLNGSVFKDCAPAYLLYGFDGKLESEHYFRHDKVITDEVEEFLKENKFSKNYKTWNDEQKMMFRLLFQ